MTTHDRRRVGAVVIALACGACGGKKGADPARLRDALAKADALAADLDAAQHKAIAAAATGAEPDAPRTCPAQIALMHGTRIANFQRVVARGVPRPSVNPAPMLDDAHSLRWQQYQHQIEWPREVASGSGGGNVDGAISSVAELSKPAFWSDDEITLVVTGLDGADVAFNTYAGGTLHGRVLVWSNTQRKLVCWAPIDVALHGTQEVGTADPKQAADELLSHVYYQGDDAAVHALGLKGDAGEP